MIEIFFMTINLITSVRNCEKIFFLLKRKMQYIKKSYQAHDVHNKYQNKIQNKNNQILHLYFTVI